MERSAGQKVIQNLADLGRWRWADAKEARSMRSVGVPASGTFPSRSLNLSRRRTCGSVERAVGRHHPGLDLRFTMFGVRRAGRTVGLAEEGAGALGDGLTLGLILGVGVVAHPADLRDERGHGGLRQEEQVGAAHVVLPGQVPSLERIPDVLSESTAVARGVEA